MRTNENNGKQKHTKANFFGMYKLNIIFHILNSFFCFILDLLFTKFDKYVQIEIDKIIYTKITRN